MGRERDLRKSSPSKPQGAIGKDLVSKIPGCTMERSSERTEAGVPRLSGTRESPVWHVGSWSRPWALPGLNHLSGDSYARGPKVINMQ